MDGHELDGDGVLRFDRHRGGGVTSDEVAALRERVAVLESQVGAGEDSGGTTATLSALSVRMETVEAAVAQVQGDVSSLQASVAALETGASDLAGRVGVVEAALGAVQGEVSSLGSSLDAEVTARETADDEATAALAAEASAREAADATETAARGSADAAFDSALADLDVATTHEAWYDWDSAYGTGGAWVGAFASGGSGWTDTGAEVTIEPTRAGTVAVSFELVSIGCYGYPQYLRVAVESSSWTDEGGPSAASYMSSSTFTPYTVAAHFDLPAAGTYEARLEFYGACTGYVYSWSASAILL
jgi:hypothetical protein